MRVKIVDFKVCIMKLDEFFVLICEWNYVSGCMINGVEEWYYFFVGSVYLEILWVMGCVMF